MKLEEIIQLDFEVLVVNGLRVGGSGGELEIGGAVDANLSALRDTLTGEPYIPGSTLKGKLRSITESVLGSFRIRDNRREPSADSPCGCGQNTCVVCTIFGAHMNTRAQ